MGEIAEAMLDGTLCEGCGTYIGDATGFPGYCSRQCARDRGAEQPDERPRLDWLRIRGRSHLKKIEAFVREQPVNTYSGPKPDRQGNMIILLGWDDRPDSDWGRFKGNRAAIWFKEAEFAIAGEAAVRKALGWGPA